jgi:hypothetical protein
MTTSTVVYYEDGSGIRYFENGTEQHFTRNITGPAPIYQHGEIYHSSNPSEVLLE